MTNSAEKMSLGAALERYLMQMRADGRSLHTVEQCERHVQLLARWAADVGHPASVASFTHEDIAAFLASTAV